MEERRVEFLARATWESEGRGIRWADAEVETRELYRRIARQTLVMARSQPPLAPDSPAAR